MNDQLNFPPPPPQHDNHALAPYQQSPYGYMPHASMLPTNKATAALVCGIIAVALFWIAPVGVTLGIVAISQSKAARRGVAAGVMGGPGNAKAGLTLGIIGLCLGGLCMIPFMQGFLGA